ncbi:MAG: IS200/IS605 family transposase [Acidobacteria bacterium]|nr:IS200/IS605 family transposase [Acidobacteriota bacterium]
MLLEPLDTICWAYQLHYYLCFRTRRAAAVFTASERVEALEAALREICERHQYHLLQSKVYPDHLRCLLSLRPAQAVSEVIQTIKANSARLFNAQFAMTPPLWGRGFLARSVGRVRLGVVKDYINGQAEHHGYNKRVRPPVLRYSDEESVALTAAHSCFELNHHLVFATRYRRGVFDSALGESLIQYWRRVASARGFAIDRVTIVPDHAHLLVRIVPKMNIEECALALLNNGQHFVGERAPEAMIHAKIEQLWQASAYAATTGKVTTALVKAFLSERE